MIIALDIDGTITRHPIFFTELSHKHDIIIVTSRPDTEDSQSETEALLTDIGVTYRHIYYCDWETMDESNIPSELEGPDRLLYQKVLACQDGQADAIFDDDINVIALMKKYFPNIAAFTI
jgi:ABC-type amino acid transport substrate-binding protein